MLEYSWFTSSCVFEFLLYDRANVLLAVAYLFNPQAFQFGFVHRQNMSHFTATLLLQRLWIQTSKHLPK